MPQHLTKLQRTEQQSLWTCCQQLEEPWDSSLGFLSSVEWRLSTLLSRSSSKSSGTDSTKNTFLGKKKQHYNFSLILLMQVRIVPGLYIILSLCVSTYVLIYLILFCSTCVTQKITEHLIQYIGLHNIYMGNTSIKVQQQQQHEIQNWLPIRLWKESDLVVDGVTEQGIGLGIQLWMG